MAIKHYNKTTQQWEMLSSSQASAIKVVDAEGHLSYENNDGNKVYAKNVEDGLQSLGRKISDINLLFEDHLENHPSGGDGPSGGGGGVMPQLNIMTPTLMNVTTDQDVVIGFSFTSPNQGIAQAYIEITGDESRSETMTLRRQGSFVGVNGWNLGAFKAGVYNVSMSVIDAGGMYAAISTPIIINSGSLEITSTFFDDFDYPVGSNIIVPYHVTSISDEPITIHYKLNNGDDEIIENIVNGYNGTIDYGIIDVAGAHTLTIWATSDGMKSNVLKYTILVTSSVGLFIGVSLDETEFEEGANINIWYRTSKRNEKYLKINYYIDGLNAGEDEIEVGVRRAWNIGKSLTVGDHHIRIEARTLDHTDATNQEGINYNFWESDITINSGDFARYTPIKDGTELFMFDAYNVSGTGETVVEDGVTKYIWRDKGQHNVRCELHGFNFGRTIDDNGKDNGANGWGGDSLAFNGNAYAVIDASPMNQISDSGIANTGFTMEIEFSAMNVGNPEAAVMSYANHLVPLQGMRVTPFYTTFKSQDSINLQASYNDAIMDPNEEHFIHLTYTVINSTPGKAGYAFIYVNGVITAMGVCNNDRFKIPNKIYLGAEQTGVNTETGAITIGNFGSCKIRSIRAYNRQLDTRIVQRPGDKDPVLHDEVMDNFISDRTLEEQAVLHNINYGTDTLPILNITHPTFFDMTIDSTYICKAQLINNHIGGFGFNLTDDTEDKGGVCNVSIQGTSSLNYPVKNYTLELRELGAEYMYRPYETWEPYHRFTIKANYMDSSSANNIGCARFFNDLCAEENPTPRQMDQDHHYRAAVDGFPIILNINGVFAGIYTFNIDRYGHDAYGFSSTKQDLAYELASNGDKFVTGGSRDETLLAMSEGFKYRYHYANKGNPDGGPSLTDGGDRLDISGSYHNDLYDLIEWTANSDGTMFSGDIKKHWALENLIDYYLTCMVLGMSDSLMKNMVIAAFGISDDGEGNPTRIWYPLMYDADSSMGMNNNGELKMHPGMDTNWRGYKFGDYQDSASNLWDKLTTYFDKEIADRYHQLRTQSKWFTVDKIMQYFYNDVIFTIGPRNYNKDMRYKYSKDTAGNPTPTRFMYCYGSREEHMRKWIYERLSYLDTRYERGEEATKSAVVRTNLNDILNFEFEVYHPQWLSVSFQDGTPLLYKRVLPGESITFSSTEIPFFDQWEGKVQNPINNNVTIRGGVTNVKRMNGLTNVLPSELLISDMKRLTSLIVRNSPYLTSASLTNNVHLQELDLQGCSRLGTGEAKTPIDISNALNLRTCNVSNTPIEILKFNESAGNLNYLNCSATKITTLMLKGQPYLAEIDANNCNYLGNVAFEKCSRLKKVEMANTSISSLDIQLCGDVEEIDISNTSNLSNLSLGGCPNLKKLTMREFASKEFTCLYLNSCPNIEYLDMAGALYTKGIIFNTAANKLTYLDISRSNVIGCGYGDASATIPSYLDLARFDLSTFKISNNPSVTEIRNLDLNTSGDMTFAYCNKLQRISCRPGGVLKLTGALNNTFYCCYELIFLPHELDLSASTSSSRAFCHCRKLPMDMVKRILDSTKNTGLSSGSHWLLFGYCYALSGKELPENLLENCKALSGLNEPFNGIKFSNSLFPKDFLKPLRTTYDANGKVIYQSKLGYFTRTFWNDVVTGVLDANFFKDLTALSHVEHCFQNSPGIVGEIPENLFATNKNLEYAHYTFNGCGVSGAIPGGLFNNNLKLRNLEATFMACKGITSIPDDILTPPNNATYYQLVDISYLFCDLLDEVIFTLPERFLHKCPALTDTSMMFYSCRGVTGPARREGETFGAIPNDFFKYSPAITTVRGMFAYTGIGGLFADYSAVMKYLKNVGDISYFFQGGTNITGAIPDDLLRYNININNISGLFKGCTSLTGNLPENLFFGVDTYGNEIKIHSAESVFEDCHKLQTTIPLKFFWAMTEVTSLKRFFYYCHEMRGELPSGDDGTELPAGEYHQGMLSKCTKLKTCESMFQEAKGIGNKYPNENNPYAVPANLFAHNLELESCRSMFSATYGYAPGPSGIDKHRLYGEIPRTLFHNNGKLLDAGWLFAGSGGITGAIPGDMFIACKNLKNIDVMFYGNTGITKLEDSFVSNNKNLTNVYGAFQGCSAMTGTAPNFWNASTVQYPNLNKSHSQNAATFSGCTSLANWDDIPINWKNGTI